MLRFNVQEDLALDYAAWDKVRKEKGESWTWVREYAIEGMYRPPAWLAKGDQDVK
jgi:hypothetical protein